MDVHSYRAATLQEALALVRRELGPQAAVLHTREVRGRILGLLPGKRQIEVLASSEVNVPSRLPQRPPVEAPAPALQATATAVKEAPATARLPLEDRPGIDLLKPRAAGRRDARSITTDRLETMLAELARRTTNLRQAELPDGLFRLYTDLIEAEVGEALARELVERVRAAAPAAELSEPEALRRRAAGIVAAEIRVTGPLAPLAGRRRVVALVGPTGVGKTTTIAKLAAQFRLRQRLQVGLITVDTYRIAAVEQLRTYADIIELPMHVVATPREMREAVDRMADLDLVLIDTAGRSPQDEERIQELGSFLSAAQADEVHLVLSSAAGAQSLVRTAERFATVGTTALVVTKLDEAGPLAHLLSLVRQSGLPISYLTNGQNVPDDIAPAQSGELARHILGLPSVGEL